MTGHPQLAIVPVTVRVFGVRADSEQHEEVGAFITLLPYVPNIGTVINVAGVSDVQWIEEDRPSDFSTRVRKADVLLGNGLKILRISLQLDPTATCVDIRADAVFVVDETVG